MGNFKIQAYIHGILGRSIPKLKPYNSVLILLLASLCGLLMGCSNNKYDQQRAQLKLSTVACNSLNKKRNNSEKLTSCLNNIFQKSENLTHQLNNFKDVDYFLDFKRKKKQAITKLSERIKPWSNYISVVYNQGGTDKYVKLYSKITELCELKNHQACMLKTAMQDTLDLAISFIQKQQYLIQSLAYKEHFEFCAKPVLLPIQLPFDNLGGSSENFTEIINVHDNLYHEIKNVEHEKLGCETADNSPKPMLSSNPNSREIILSKSSKTHFLAWCTEDDVRHTSGSHENRIKIHVMDCVQGIRELRFDWLDETSNTLMLWVGDKYYEVRAEQ